MSMIDHVYEQAVKEIDDLRAQLTAQEAEIARLRAFIVKAHDLVSRPGQSERHDHEGCLIDGILNLMEGVGEARRDATTAEASLSALREYVQHKAECGVYNCGLHPEGKHECTCGLADFLHGAITDQRTEET